MRCHLEHPLREFWHRTWTEWRNGALDSASPAYANFAKDSFEGFVRTYESARDPRATSFFTEHPPRSGEFFFGYMADRAVTVLAMTNFRVWLWEPNEQRLMELELKDLLELSSTAAWSGRRVLVIGRDGVDQQYFCSTSPTDDAASLAIGLAASAYGSPGPAPLTAVVGSGCSSCGANGEHPIRYVACASKTDYSGGTAASRTIIDDVRLWSLRLCDSCSLKVRSRRWRHTLLDNLKAAAIGVLVLAIAAAALLITGDTYTRLIDGESLNEIVGAVGSAGFFGIALLGLGLVSSVFAVIVIGAGLMHALYSTAQWIRACIAPAPIGRELDQVYVAAAERILTERIGKNRTASASNVFRLPLRTRPGAVHPAEQAKAAGHDGHHHVRVILPVAGATLEDLIGKLPEDARACLESAGR